MTVEKTIARKSLSVALALALGLLPGGFAWSAGNVARPVVVAPATAGVGAAAMSRVSLNHLALGSLTPMVPAQLAPSLNVSATLDVRGHEIAAALPALAAAPAAADPAVDRHPIVGIINDLRARGVEIPQTLTASDAPALLALAKNLPEGSAKQDMLTFAQALGQRGGSVDASAPSGRMFDGLGKTASEAVAGAVAAAPQSGWSWTGLVSKLTGRGTPAPAPQEPAKPSNPGDYKVPLNELRWSPAAKEIPLPTSQMTVADKQIVGQDDALKAMRFGLKMGVTADGDMGRNYNMFVSGPDGSGRETALRHLLAEVAPTMKTPGDLVVAANFEQMGRPVLLSLPTGRGPVFVKAVRQFVMQAKTVLPKALNQGPVAQQKQQIMAQVKAQLDAALAAVQAEAKAVAMPAGYSLVFVFEPDHQTGTASYGTQVLYEGKPLVEGVETPKLKEAMAILEAKAPEFLEKFTAAVEKNNEMGAQAMAQIAQAEAMGVQRMIASMGQGLLAAVMPEKAASPEEEALQARVNAFQEQFAAKIKAIDVEGFGVAMVPGQGVVFTYQGEILEQTKVEELVAAGSLTPAKWSTIQDALQLQFGRLSEEQDAAMAAFGKEQQDLILAKNPELAALNKRMTAWQEAFDAKVKAVSVEKFGIIFVPGLGVGFTYEGKPLPADGIKALMASGALTPGKWATVQDALKLQARQFINERNEAMKGFMAEQEKLAAKTGGNTKELVEAQRYVQSLISFAASNYQLFLGRGERSEDDEEDANPLAALLGAGGRKMPTDPMQVFGAHLLVGNGRSQGVPTVWEKNPTFENLFNLENGSFHRANGGYLVVNAMDLLQSGGYYALMRAIRSGEVQVADRSLIGMLTGRGYSYSIPNNVKVILVGAPSLRMMLERYDEDYARNFQAVAEFEPRVTIAEGTVASFVQVIKNMVAQGEGKILDFSQDAMSALLEQAARMADSHKKMTAQFGALFGLLRESSHWAQQAGRTEVRREDVQQALKTKQDREETYRRHLIDIYKKDVFVVKTSGKPVVGQVNGLAVMGSFGVPMRVTVRVSRAGGAGGIVSVDRNAGTTGSSFNKALGVVEGFLEGLFAADKVFPAKLSVSYEQNYGGIDGDSATSTELYGILSALSNVGIGQNFAITGSADQFGNVQAIGGVNEKIEGYFELAKSRGLTGDQGILIPKSNVADLQLSAEVVEAVAKGQFHIYAVDHISQGMEILTGVAYSEVIAKAEERLKAMRLAPLKEQMEAKKALGIK